MKTTQDKIDELVGNIELKTFNDSALRIIKFNNQVKFKMSNENAEASLVLYRNGTIYSFSYFEYQDHPSNKHLMSIDSFLELITT